MHAITDRRIIPQTSAAVSMATGKVVHEKMNRAGEVAVCVKLADGRMAWGFGATDDIAETRAVAKASSV